MQQGNRAASARASIARAQRRASKSWRIRFSSRALAHPVPRPILFHFFITTVQQFTSPLHYTTTTTTTIVLVGHPTCI
jgi:hypothetical protein